MENEERPQTDVNVAHSGHGTQGALPSALVPGPTPRSDEEYQKEEYLRASESLDKAKELLKMYEELGILPCNISRIHSAVRSAFGYGPV